LYEKRIISGSCARVVVLALIVTLPPNRFGGSVTVRDTLTGDVLTTLPPYNHGVIGIAWSPDGTLLATASGRDNPLIKLWDTRDGELVHAFVYDEPTNPPPGFPPLGDIHSVTFSPDGALLATGNAMCASAFLWRQMRYTHIPHLLKSSWHLFRF
jgi:WD40 repeat protein